MEAAAAAQRDGLSAEAEEAADGAGGVETPRPSFQGVDLPASSAAPGSPLPRLQQAVQCRLPRGHEAGRRARKPSSSST